MKIAVVTCLSALVQLATCRQQENPLGAVLSLLHDLTAKITKDGEAEAKAYAEYVEWCDEVSANSGYAIETATKAKAKLEAEIQDFTGNIQAAGSKIEGLAADLATAEQDLKDATTVRDKETNDFVASEHELVEAMDALSRAINILEREMAKNPAAFTQVDSKNMAGALKAFKAVFDAAAFVGSDQKKLAALVQSQQGESDDDDDELGSPAAAVYKSKSGNIVDVLEDLKEKAEGQLSDLRKAETNTKHNFEMLKQSLENQMAASTKDMDETKSNKAAAQEGLATAQGDLAGTTKDLANSKQQRATAQSTCMQVAADHQATLAARKEELQVIAEAMKLLSESTSGAVGQTYSFFQLVTVSATSVRMQTNADLAGREVIELVRRLAKKMHSTELTQLASRIAAVARFGSANGEDVFAKVKGLIQDMIQKLEAQAGSEATEKAYCDEQMSKTKAKKDDLEFDINKLTTKIDKATAKSAQLKAEVKDLQAQLSSLARTQAEMDKVRIETRKEYETAKADLEQGLSGVRKALSTLRDYYGGATEDTAPAALMQRMEQPALPVKHTQSAGAGGSVISILEVVESDFATNLAKEETAEADAQSEYDRVSQENAVTKTLKDQDVKYKTKEAKSLDATVSEYSSDRETSNTELTAVLDFYAKIKERCIAKPETYEERSRRRTEEIQGLKEALSILEDETALVQRKHRGSFRGTLAAQ